MAKAKAAAAVAPRGPEATGQRQDLFGPQWLRVLLAVSILANAVLWRQVQEAGKHSHDAELRAATEDTTRQEADAMEHKGQVFMAAKLGELVAKGLLDITPQALKDVRKIPDEALAVPGADILSVHITAAELEQRSISSETARRISQRLDEHGLVILPRVIDDASAKRLLEHTNNRIMNPIYDMNPVREFMYRKDVPLEIKGPVRDAMERVFPLIKPAIDEFLGNGAPLREVGAMNSYPGTKAQIFHEDSNLSQGKATFITGFLYLDSIRDDQAPLDAYPGTHRPVYNRLSDAVKETIEQWSPFVRASVPRGSLVLYNSLLRHRGSANTSPLLRPTMYFSFYQADEKEPDGAFTFLDAYTGLDIAKVLAGKIPMVPVTIAQKHHKDQACLDNMRAKCPGLAGLELYKCAINRAGATFRSDDEDDWWPDDPRDFHVPPNCALINRMEKLAQVGIYSPNYTVLTSDGPLA
ncbi:Hypothetical Protein FCC1311_078972 [Hondaea fermentalgiana]|uniref:Phytanoyl-CoA dioxygenase n=1 Tax=Hondaea fermentalgiana TaxID=2315210 RepID=A0A2R5GL88_9STRA|nr:Hypothetical Protein FCC1311_078972 [Hondaea fermentalgiana]|eukprot:GBG31672.1 Hypothetical Protein FCC1311_078972 [Hondaea fermentalgiana]